MAGDPQRIMVIAGEASGDLHGASLVREIRRIRPEAEFFGIGGPGMAQQGVTLSYRVDQMAFMGFAEVVRHLPFVRRVLSEMRSALARKRPSLLVLIDYPGFNLRLAKTAHRLGIPVLYYISPQIWAWGRSRITRIRQCVTCMAVILPFEEEMYRRQGVPVRFVGHPLLDVVRPTMGAAGFRARYGIGPRERVIGLLPGSRRQEVTQLLPIMLDAGRRIGHGTGKVRLLIGAADTLDDAMYRQAVPEGEHAVVLARHAAYDVMKHADLLLVASGTATLESAILGTPMVVVYRVAPLSYALARLLLDVPHIALVNVVAGRRIVPELLQAQACPERIAAAALEILGDDKARAAMRSELSRIRSLLGEPGAAERAAQMAVEMLSEDPAN